MNLQLAKKIVERCINEAQEMGVKGTVSVLDEGGNLVALQRMDGSILGSIMLSQKKAYTAVSLGAPTDRAAFAAAPGAPLYGIQHTGAYVVFGGGVPVMKDGVLIGGIGFSGGSPEQDAKVAASGLSEI